MKVLYIVTAYPRDPSDVITPWLVETIQRLRAQGVDVEVLAPAYRGQPSSEIDGVRVHRFRYAPAAWETLTHDQTAPDRVRERPWYLALVPGYVIAGSRAAARLARTGEYDIVHAFWPIPHGLLGMAAKRATGVPLVTTFFGVELTWLESDLSLLRPILRRIVRASDAVTVISSYTAGKLRAAVGAVNAAIIPFGATVPALPPVPEVEERAARGGEFEVLFVGRLVERKGVHVLLEALALLGHRPGVRVRIVGGGPLRGALERQAATLGVADRVRFDGSVGTDELVRRFRECDVFVLPAVVDAKGDTEGLGVVLIEALSYGKPVIASAAGGIVDIVRDGETGLLVPPGDAPALARAIERAMDDPAEQRELASGGRAHVERAFGWDTVIEALIGIYARLSVQRRS